MRIPIVKADSLWHWGDLDINRKGENWGVLEGNLFSMSACPNAWSQICNLGEKPLHKSIASAFLIDAYAIYSSHAHYAKKIRKEIEQWGLNEGLLSLDKVYVLEKHNKETGSEDQIFYMSRNQAIAAVDDCSDLDCIEMLVPTERFKAIHGFTQNAVIRSDYVLIDWARANTYVDGVFWSDHSNLAGHCAPRCGLFKVPGLVIVNPNALQSDDRIIGASPWIYPWGIADGKCSCLFVEG